MKPSEQRVATASERHVAKSVIHLERLTKHFGKVPALDDVSLDVPAGVVFALLGENGAGKSTCIRLMLGFGEPDRGRAEVLGLNSQRDWLEIRRQVGYVPERPVLYDWMTVREIGWFTAGFYDQAYLRSYLHHVDQFALPQNKKIKHLSKGMRAKVSLALALSNDPQLLILDEPTSGLDTLVRREFLESMVDRAAEGQTVFLSSHQIPEVERVADYVGILHHGRLVAVDRLERLKAETVEVTITLTDPNASPPPVAGELLRQQRRSKQWQLLVRSHESDVMQQLQSAPSVEFAEARTPSLDEIFLGFLRSDVPEEERDEQLTKRR